MLYSGPKKSLEEQYFKHFQLKFGVMRRKALKGGNNFHWGLRLRLTKLDLVYRLVSESVENVSVVSVTFISSCLNFIFSQY
jgi:hypothetical protein